MGNMATISETFDKFKCLWPKTSQPEVLCHQKQEYHLATDSA